MWCMCTCGLLLIINRTHPSLAQVELYFFVLDEAQRKTFGLAAGRAAFKLVDTCELDRVVKLDYLSNPEPCLNDAWRAGNTLREDFCANLLTSQQIKRSVLQLL